MDTLTHSLIISRYGELFEYAKANGLYLSCKFGQFILQRKDDVVLKTDHLMTVNNFILGYTEGFNRALKEKAEVSE